MTTDSLYAWKMKYGPNEAEHEERTATEQEVRRLKKELKRVNKAVRTPDCRRERAMSYT